MKRLLITTGIYPPEIGGPATHAALIATALNAKVLTYSKWLRRVPQPFRQIFFVFKTWWASRNADIIYALSPLGTGIAAALSRKPFVVRVAGDRAWEDAVNSGKTSLLIDDYQHLQKKSLKRRLQTWVCKKARIVVVPSRYLEGIVTGWGIPKDRIRIVPNAVSDGVLTESKETLRKELGIQGNLIVSVGRLVPWKGFRMLVKIMPQLLEINPFFRLVIVGDGPDTKLLTTMVRNLNLQNKIYLVGRKTPEITAKYVAAADIFILNTGYEGFSHQLLSTMRQGIPVITSGIGGNRELIQQGENGFMVKYNDEFNLIEAVKTLWGSPELRKKFSEAGKQTASAFTPERTIQETKAILESGKR